MNRLSIPGRVFLWSAFICFFLMCFPCGASAGFVHEALSPSEKALAAGCTGYIEKPINPETFIAEMEKYLMNT